MGTVITLPRELFSAEVQKWTYLRVKRIASSKAADLAGLRERTSKQKQRFVLRLSSMEKTRLRCREYGRAAQVPWLSGTQTVSERPGRSRSEAVRPLPLSVARSVAAGTRQGSPEPVRRCLFTLRRFRNPRFSSLTGEEWFLL